MSPLTRYRPIAAADIQHIAWFIARDSVEGAIRVLRAIDAATTTLAQFPAAGRVIEPPLPQIPGMRIWALTRFPSVLVFYVPIDNGIRVMRIMRAARDFRAAFGGDDGSD